MESAPKTVITVQVKINVPVEQVWKLWTTAEDIVKWNNASNDWHTTKAENNLSVGGSFTYRMEAKDGSMGFDFGGTYETVFVNKQIDYIIADGRKVKIVFTAFENQTEVVETFESENTHPTEMQQKGWQAILDNFKNYAEANYH